MNPITRNDLYGRLPVLLQHSLCCICFIMFVAAFPVQAQVPALTLCFMNPQYNCTGEMYCVDAALRSDMSQVELFGANIRFFYDDTVLEFLAFGDFQGGYGLLGTPAKTTGTAESGAALFGFPGPAEYINGAIQLQNTQAPPLYIATGGWTRLFRIYFTVKATGEKSEDFFPALVLDLKAVPSEGGFLGNSGVVMTVIPSTSKDSAPANEQVVQFNWEYSESSIPPYGHPALLTGAPCGAVFSVPHPADSNTDYSIKMNEAIHYLTGWQQGGNPLGQDIRGAYLWQNGEQYRYDPENKVPLCWVLL